MSETVNASIVGKVVSLPVKLFKGEGEANLDHERIDRFEKLLVDELAKHSDFQSFQLAHGARMEYHIKFATSCGDQELTDYVNRCRRTAMRRLHGNKNRKEREQCATNQ